MDTLATMRRQLLTYLKEDEDPQLCNDAINDSIESLWQSCILIHLGQFLGGPVTNLQLSAGAERATIVSVPDPVQLIAGNVAQTPNVSGQPNLPARTYLFGITYVTSSGSETKPDYSAVPAAPLSVAIGGGQLAVVTPPSSPNIPSGDPIGYNIYVSFNPAAVNAPDPGNLIRQNPLPIPFNQTWTEPPNGPVTQGNPDLQPPVSNTTADNIFFIRVLEVQNPDQTWTRWQAGSLDGLMMDRLVKWIAPQTTYERYAYDFVNGNTLEIRPALGQSLNPRYFFVIKPRRLAYDNAIVPFTNLPYTSFVKFFAAAECHRSEREFTAASQDAAAAEMERKNILLGLNTQATSKQKNITPYFRW